ncbi:MAG: HNH endonuclease [Selenomonadaceae bacterium]|nr:HNH endonuclease [Selenomonadaceae bacterium]
MKDQNKVVDLIDQLKAEAETPFELHRIEVLEKDLLEGAPTIEIIDETHQKFNGTIYSKKDKEKTGHYFRYIPIHRAVWQYHNGEIPQNYHIHHIDGNKDNNSIENLLLLTIAEHTKLHHQVSKTLHICEYCGNEFWAYTNQKRFCSHACYQKHHLQETQETRFCAICGKSFSADKYSSTACCSKTCGHKLQSKTRTLALKERICPICGKKFLVHNYEQRKYCSAECANKARSLSHLKPPLEKNCVICGKTFFTKKKEQFCCSTSCAAISQGLKKRKKHN